MSAATQPEAAMPTDLSPREVAALTEYLYVYPELGRAAGAADLFVVYSEAGVEYLVDAREQTCECDDHWYRGETCKHLHRVAFATGEREIPDWVDRDRVDQWLLERVDGLDS